MQGLSKKEKELMDNSVVIVGESRVGGSGRGIIRVNDIKNTIK